MYSVPSREEVIRKVYSCRDLCEFEENKDGISAYSEVHDKYYRFNFLENIDYDNIFDFGSLNVDKENFYKILKEKVNPILFSSIKKVLFISHREELRKTEDYKGDYGVHHDSFTESILASGHLQKSIITINVSLIKETAKNCKELYGFNYKVYMNELLWTSLLSNLVRMTILNGKIVCDDEIIKELSCKGNENETYSDKVFDNDISCESFLVFK